MELVLGLVTSIVANLLKKLVARYGALAVQALVLVVTLLVAWAWTLYGDALNWEAIAIVFGTAFAWYELIISRFWSNK